jgi:hypothetical protein
MMPRQHQWRHTFGTGMTGTFNRDSTSMDQRHSGFPCRIDHSCAYIAHSRADNLAHEALTHPVFPTSPPASAAAGAIGVTSLAPAAVARNRS